MRYKVNQAKINNKEDYKWVMPRITDEDDGFQLFIVELIENDDNLVEHIKLYPRIISFIDCPDQELKAQVPSEILWCVNNFDVVDLNRYMDDGHWPYLLVRHQLKALLPIMDVPMAYRFIESYDSLESFTGDDGYKGIEEFEGYAWYEEAMRLWKLKDL